MTAYNASPFAPSPVRMVGGRTEWLFGNQSDSISPTLILVNSVAITSNVATVTGTVTSGNAPAVGSLVSIQGTATDSGLFNVTNVALASATTNATTGAITITFALTHANVSTTTDFGFAQVPPPITYDAMIAGGSSKQASSAENDPSTNDERSYWAQVFFGLPLPVAATVTLQGSSVDLDSAYQNLGTVATIAGSAVTQNAASFSNLNIKFLRFNVSTVGFSGSTFTATIGSTSTSSIGSTNTAAIGSTSTGTSTGTSIALTSLTGFVSIGDTVSGTGITAGTTVVSQTSGTTGLAGTYVLSTSGTASAATITTFGTTIITSSTTGLISVGDTVHGGSGFPVGATVVSVVSTVVVISAPATAYVASATGVTTFGKVLKVISGLTGIVSIGDTVSGGSGFPAAATIVSQTSGTTGSTGVYVISAPATAYVASAASVTTFGTTINITAVATGNMYIGAVIAGTNVPSGATLTAQVTGTTGSTGLYTFSPVATQYVASESMTSTAGAGGTIAASIMG